MEIRILLFARGGQERVGRIEFHHIAALEPRDYDCRPRGLLSQEQVRTIAQQVRNEPACDHGEIGSFVWRAVRPAAMAAVVAGKRESAGCRTTDR